MKLKIGDKVKVTKPNSGSDSYKGRVGKITEWVKDYGFWRVRFPNEPSDWGVFYSGELSPLPKVKKEKDKLAFMRTFTFPPLKEMRASLKKAGWGRTERNTIISGLKTLPEYQSGKANPTRRKGKVEKRDDGYSEEDAKKARLKALAGYLKFIKPESMVDAGNKFICDLGDLLLLDDTKEKK